MKKTVLTLAVSHALLGFSSFAFGEEVGVLEEVNVVAKEDEVFKKPWAVSKRGDSPSMGSLDSVVRGIPGAFTNIDPTQGTINVNIRGMSGLGRVNTTVDGVPQTLFGTSSNGGSRFHDNNDGAAGPTSSFGTTVDSNLLSGVSIDKGFAHGANGVNALAGSAEMKTLDVDDLLLKGNKIGILSKFSTGSNAYGYNGMLGMAGKTQAFSQNGSIGAMFAHSWRKTSPDYKDGNGVRHTDNPYVLRQHQRPTSWLAKIEANLSENNSFKFSGREYKTNIGGRQLNNKNYSVEYNFNSGSPLINISALASHTKNDQIFNKDAMIWSLFDSSSHNRSNYFNVENNSFITFGKAELILTTGVSQLNNHYYRVIQFDPNNTSPEYSPFAPSGKQSVSALYFTGEYKQDIYSLKSGITYNRNRFSGFKPACGEVEGVSIPCFPRGEANINKKEGSFSPSVMLSADFSKWFSPFVSYAKSKRMPNIQEVFFNNEAGGSMNPHLKPEKADTYQIGFNTLKHDLITDDDHLGIKAVYYRTKTKDYIYSERFFINNQGSYTTNIDDALAGFQAQISINSPTPLKTSGTELEINYDSGNAFAFLSYGYQKTSQPMSVQASVDGFGFGDIYELPKHNATLDMGARLFDKKLTLGSTLKYHGTVYRISPLIESGTTVLKKQKLPTKPVTADFYATYQFNKHFILKLSVQNAFNAVYVDPLNSQNGLISDYDVDENDNDVFKFSNTARGRTYVVGGEIRF